MKLGIIAQPVEESFNRAQRMGLEFLEFCINEGNDGEDFYRSRAQIKEWMQVYGQQIASVGRWKSVRIDQEGRVIPSELEICRKLIDTASDLGCENVVVGCNYVEERSYYENCTSAIAFFTMLMEYAQGKGVHISTYNCRKVNFVHNPAAWTIIHGHLKELGIKFDPSHSRYFGGDYLQETLDWGDRYRHVHLKGSMIVGGQRVDDPPAGLDQTDWKTFLSLLRVKGYTGGLSIEPHSPVWTGELGEQGIQYTIRYMNELLFRG
ncbi:sugar phosphate isomerase/epimerase [Paenibacillus phyllosphaerae]|uniref:Sugar phosphate isomerase/epimerase n=1 Tax=Paenibacillus phyllosphaerae TaxID=274593 RepID=A0A7W5AY68_9BACL|nr:sugar phosphate isomerase/epimerase [Paenibacillus phyllosphaerae]MBB3110929.1 sugar phosphate isomerase/epimerase [Paenibacillus phyllosphaerae]